MKLDNRPACSLAVVLAALLCGGTISHPPADDNILVLTNLILIDGTGRRAAENRLIVIKNRKITRISNPDSIQIPRGAKRLDLNSGYVLPGFFNTHVHEGYTRENLAEWAWQGVTTVRDLGKNYNNSLFSLRDFLLKDNKNARLVAAGPMVTTPGGYGSFTVISVRDAREKITRLIRDGADLIKIGIEDDLQGRQWPMLPEDIIKTIVDTAHQNDRKVSAHISRASHLEMAVRAGVDDVAHMIIDGLGDDLLKQMIKKRIYWIPTLELWKGVSLRHGLNWDKTSVKNLFKFLQAGGQVALGTDFAGYSTEFELGMPINEILLMKEAGMDPMQIIVAATRNAARVCGLEKELGTIEAGKTADLIVIKGNPLADLKNLKNIIMVIHNGEIIRNEL